MISLNLVTQRKKSTGSDKWIQNSNNGVQHVPRNCGALFAANGYSFNYQDYIMATKQCINPVCYYWDRYYQN